jgi:phage terminase large subunit-like protein
MAHILSAIQELKKTIDKLREDFVSRTHYEGEITALKLRIDTLSKTVETLTQEVKKSPLESVTRFFSGVSVVLAGVIALYVVAQWVVKHA